MSTTREQPRGSTPFPTVSLIENDPQECPDRLRWWHRSAAPPVPAETASLSERDAYRRGKYISNTLLGMLGVFTVLLIVIGGIVNHQLIPVFVVALLVVALASYLNKKGKVILSGVLVVFIIDASILLAFPTYPRLTPFLLPLFDLLVLPEIFAASLLPTYFVFFDMAFHIIFVFCSLTFLFPKDPLLAAYLAQRSNFTDTQMMPVVIQVVVAIVSYTWMSSVQANIRRAERATSIALLEKDIAERSRQEAEQKRFLEREIQEIIQVHTQVANGNFNARVPLRRGNMLWAVAGSLNNLIARLQNLLKESQQLRQTHEALARFFHARNDAKNNSMPWQPTGTAVDILVRQHNMLASTPSSSTNEQFDRSTRKLSGHLE